MASVKNVSSDYTLNCNIDALGEPQGIFTINARDVVIPGNIVTPQPAISTAPFITVAAENTGALHNMGLLGQTSLTTFAGLRFSTDDNNWQVCPSVDAAGNPVSPNQYATLATGNVNVAGVVSQIQFNGGGDFAGAANLTYQVAGTATGNTSVLTLSGLEKFNQIGNAYANIEFTPSATYVYSNPVESGGTGLYFISPDPTDTNVGIGGELVSKTKAIVYSIIF